MGGSDPRAVHPLDFDVGEEVGEAGDFNFFACGVPEGRARGGGGRQRASLPEMPDIYSELEGATGLWEGAEHVKTQE
jgi:hypothetical protein